MSWMPNCAIWQTKLADRSSFERKIGSGETASGFGSIFVLTAKSRVFGAGDDVQPLVRLARSWVGLSGGRWAKPFGYARAVSDS